MANLETLSTPNKPPTTCILRSHMTISINFLFSSTLLHVDLWKLVAHCQSNNEMLTNSIYHDRGSAIQQRTVRDVSMSSNPSYIRSTEIHFARMIVKRIFVRRGSV